MYNKQFEDRGMYIEYEFTSPYNIRLVVYNNIEEYDLTDEMMKSNMNYASSQLLNSRGDIPVTRQLKGLRNVDESDRAVNLFGTNSFLFRAFDLPVYSWGG